MDGKILGIIVATALIICLTVVNQADALRCSSRVMRVGDPREKIRHFCGEPDHIEKWSESDPLWSYDEDNDIWRYHYRHMDLTRIERWTYNFGPTQFIRYLRFENGVLKKITIGEYGY